MKAEVYESWVGYGSPEDRLDYPVQNLVSVAIDATNSTCWYTAKYYGFEYNETWFQVDDDDPRLCAMLRELQRLTSVSRDVLVLEFWRMANTGTRARRVLPFRAPKNVGPLVCILSCIVRCLD